MNPNRLHAAVLIAFAAADGCAAIEPMMQLRPLAGADDTVELLIYGNIGDSWWGESVTAKSVVEQLNALPASVTTINVRVNSYGGSVADGLAIYNALKRHDAKKVVTVDGVAMSSGSLIVMSGDVVKMPSASMLMIHAPWGLAQGNANDMREFADVLDTFADAMASAYAAKSGESIAEMRALLKDGKDHYYTGEQAVDAGFADELIDPTEPAEEDEAEARAFATGLLERFLVRAPQDIALAAMAAAKRGARLAPIPEPAQPAGDNEMKRTLRARAKLQTPDGKGGGSSPAATPAPAPAPAATETEVLARVKARNDEIHAALAPILERDGIRALYDEALRDPTMSVEVVRAKALNLLGKEGAPAGGGGVRVDSGADESDKRVEAATNWILARASAESRDKDGKTDKLPKADRASPYFGMKLHEIAEDCLVRAGVKTAGLTRNEIVSRAMQRHAIRGAAGHTTSDFPNLLENALNKLLIAAYVGAPTTFERICRAGDLSDFRAHKRYRVGTFGDLLEVKEDGNYQQGTIKDADKESITAKRKGRLLVVTREVIVNDDLQAFTDLARGLGRVAARTVDKDVYAMFGENSGAGPTMGDGVALFHANHNNIAGTSAAPTMASIEAGRVLMSRQKDVSDNDFLDLRPALWIGPVEKGGEARTVNDSQYDPDANSKLQRPNIVRGLFRDVVDTPRLSGTAWFLFADPNEEPVFEVGYIDGQRQPRVESMTDFDSDSLKWKVVHEYGVAAIGWRGAVKNAGA